MSHVDRLGDALREIARGMADHTKDRVRVTVVIGKLEATYELKLVSVRTPLKRPRADGKHVHRRRHVLP